jgi:FkbH-like protein
MKLIEALSIIKSGASITGPLFRVTLATGFTPLHLETFLKAHLFQYAPTRQISVEHGLFGDLAGNIERAGAANAVALDAVVVVIEWEDLDARLGVRTLGGWTVAALPDILQSAQLTIERISAALRSVAAHVVVSLPTLPFPPVSYTSPREISRLELELQKRLHEFAAAVGTNVRVLHPNELDLISPAGSRFDLQNAVATGFPYSLEHADGLANLLANLSLPRVPKKGLITDLDDTLWAGILGDTGIQGVTWNLDGKAQIHGLYQRLLASLGSAGVLIGVASKNDPALVQEIFAERSDLLLSAEDVFPMESNWGPKSESVKLILRDWNIGPGDVVFIDDSPMEVAEVQAAFPEMECIVFPKKSYPELWTLLRRLRETFAKSSVLDEDKLRLDSLRAGVEFREQSGNSSAPDQLLRHAEAEISFSRDKRPDPRAFELINKTNQFNINGVRLTEAEWNALLADPGSFVLKLGYRDRFGPLGSIAVIAGRCYNRDVRIENWVMSCRAFSRRIEHQTLKLLFDSFPVDELLLAYTATPRNGPTREFLESYRSPLEEGTLRITREQFQNACPPLYHSLKDELVANHEPALKQEPVPATEAQ